jgi:hypothetical protein
MIIGRRGPWIGNNRASTLVFEVKPESGINLDSMSLPMLS